MSSMSGALGIVAVEIDVQKLPHSQGYPERAEADAELGAQVVENSVVHYHISRLILLLLLTTTTTATNENMFYW